MSEYENIIKALAELEELKASINGAMKTIKDQCECPEDMRTNKEYYFSGSYNDKAYTEHWTECAVCGKRYDKRIEQHSWYG